MLLGLSLSYLLGRASPTEVSSRAIYLKPVT